MTDGNQVEGSLFLYAPNKGAAIFFTVAFAVTAAVHLWQCQYVPSALASQAGKDDAQTLT